MGSGAPPLPGVARTLRDASLGADADTIRDGYVARFTARVAAAWADYQGTLRELQDKGGAAADDAGGGSGRPGRPGEGAPALLLFCSFVVGLCRFSSSPQPLRSGPSRLRQCRGRRMSPRTS